MHIRTQREILKQVLRKYEVGDIYDFFLLIWNDANLIREIENEFMSEQDKELTKYLDTRLEKNSCTKQDLENEFMFRVEKNRGRSLDMWEMNDIYEAIEDWARHNWYAYLFD